MKNCGWCGKVDDEFIKNCITDSCAMKPSQKSQCGCGKKCESRVDKMLGYRVECSGQCENCSCKNDLLKEEVNEGH